MTEKSGRDCVFCNLIHFIHFELVHKVVNAHGIIDLLYHFFRPLAKVLKENVLKPPKEVLNALRITLIALQSRRCRMKA